MGAGLKNCQGSVCEIWIGATRIGSMIKNPGEYRIYIIDHAQPYVINGHIGRALREAYSLYTTGKRIEE